MFQPVEAVHRQTGQQIDGPGEHCSSQHQASPVPGAQKAEEQADRDAGCAEVAGENNDHQAPVSGLEDRSDKLPEGIHVVLPCWLDVTFRPAVCQSVVQHRTIGLIT